MNTCKRSKQRLCSGEILHCPPACHELAGMLYSAAEESVCSQYLACDGVRKTKSLSGLRRTFSKNHRTNMTTTTTFKLLPSCPHLHQQSTKSIQPKNHSPCKVFILFPSNYWTMSPGCLPVWFWAIEAGLHHGSWHTKWRKTASDENEFLQYTLDLA